MKTQRWRDKLHATGAIAPPTSGAESSNVVSVGGGIGLVAPQYATPSGSTAALANVIRHKGEDSNRRTAAEQRERDLDAGVPRGADFYGTVHDGVPDAKMDPPPSGRIRGAQ